jgi:glycosyltransferase involved in cell wall biosynthesis
MGRPTVFVFCPDYDVPSGGVRKLYRHVDVLNAHGQPAAVLHHREGFRCSWFPNATRVVSAAQARVSRSDYVVLPEVYRGDLAATAPGSPKVIFNQNCYLTFPADVLERGPAATPYRSPEVVAALVVSEDSREYLSYAFPGLRVLRLRYGIDTKLFAPRGPKRRLVAYLPRKNADHAGQVLALLRLRGALAGYELAAVDGRPPEEVAAVLRASAVFLSFGFPEGFGLPAAEAMACGCVAVGYHGGGGKEFWRRDFSYPVEVGDVVGFARAAEEVLRGLREAPRLFERKAEAAAAFIRERYSLEHEEGDIVRAWATLLGGAAESPPARI